MELSHRHIDDIDLFIEKMKRVLPYELVEYIIRKYIFLPKNKGIIWRQKALKNILNRHIEFVANVLFIDDNYCIYFDNNKLVIHNHGNTEYDLSLYHQNGHQTDIQEVNNNFLLTSSNMIVNGTEFTNVLHTNDNNVDVNVSSSNIVMYIMYA